MANIHFGKIGDVWKHLALAEVLNIERPRRYWESNAGSALYELTHSAERDYGVFHFYNKIRAGDDLADSGYARLLAGPASESGYPERYPGSAYIAMSVLGQGTEYLFCDLDPASLSNIQNAEVAFGLDGTSVELCNADGVTTLLKKASQLDVRQAQETLIFVDPCGGLIGGKYVLDDPYLPRSDGAPSPLEAFLTLTQAGMKGMFWYGFDSVGTESARDVVHNRIQASVAGLNTSKDSLWCGEVFIAAIDQPVPDPGVMGCGVLCVNMTPGALTACELLGKQLTNLYRDAVLADGSSGALVFSVVEFCSTL